MRRSARVGCFCRARFANPPLPDRDTALRISTNCRLLANCRLPASLQPAFKHREVVHELLDADARRSRELLGRGVIQRCGGTAELVSAPGERASLAQERGDRSRRRRIRTVHVTLGHAVDSRCTTTDLRPIEPRHQCRKWIPWRAPATSPGGRSDYAPKTRPPRPPRPPPRTAAAATHPAALLLQSRRARSCPPANTSSIWTRNRSAGDTLFDTDVGSFLRFSRSSREPTSEPIYTAGETRPTKSPMVCSSMVHVAGGEGGSIRHDDDGRPGRMNIVRVAAAPRHAADPP